MSHIYNRLEHFILYVITPALKTQIILFYGLLLSLGVEVFYYYINDERYQTFSFDALGIGAFLALLAFGLGVLLDTKQKEYKQLHLAEGAQIIFFVWLIACLISGIVFFVAGFPMPADTDNFTLARRLMDGVYESMSGFTTTGTSILPDIEVFSRGVLFWRSLTHFIGGMGIATMAITLYKGFTTPRSEMINGEAESPHTILFDTKEEAHNACYQFLKPYTILTISLVILLIISGYFFRITAYTAWYDNLYDAVLTAFSTMGTGGFMHYNTSVGLPVLQNGEVIQAVGGLQNIVSEWIMAFYMAFAGINMALWYIIFYEWKHIKSVFQNVELRTYALFIFSTTALITGYLLYYTDYSFEQSARYAFFNVSTIISTTGAANNDFTLWPVAAQGILFLCYLVGGMVGSTGGGLKFLRYIISAKWMYHQLRNWIFAEHIETIKVDGNTYNAHDVNLILATIMIYFGMFMVGGVLLMMSSSEVYFTDGSKRSMDFVSAFTATIANLGNIGPALVNGVSGDGPTGNYSAFSTAGKLLMFFLMFFGRVGVLSLFMYFMTPEAEKQELLEETGDANTIEKE